MSAPKLRGTALCGFLCVLLWSFSVGAQSDQERAGARMAGREGVEAYTRGDYEEAIELLLRAQSLVDAPTHLLFIARSQAKLGKLVEAREAYKKIIVTKLPPNAPDAFRDAQNVAPDELDTIEGRIGKLKIEVTTPSGEAAEGLEVKLNGVPLSSALIGLSVPANPGLNEVEASAPGMATVTKTVELSEAESITVQLILASSLEAEAGSENTENAGTGEKDVDAGGDKSNSKRTAGWAIAGTGAAVGVAGGVIGFLSMNQLSAVRKDEDLCGSERVCTPEGRKQVNSAFTKALIGDISMGVGLLAVGIGTYLIVSNQPEPQKVGLRSVVPSADQHGGYVVMEGGF